MSRKYILTINWISDEKRLQTTLECAKEAVAKRVKDNLEKRAKCFVTITEKNIDVSDAGLQAIAEKLIEEFSIPKFNLEPIHPSEQPKMFSFDEASSRKKRKVTSEKDVVVEKPIITASNNSPVSALREEIFGKPDMLLQPNYVYDHSGKWCDYCVGVKSRATICFISPFDSSIKSYFCKKDYQNRVKSKRWTHYRGGPCDVKECGSPAEYISDPPNNPEDGIRHEDHDIRCGFHIVDSISVPIML